MNEYAGIAVAAGIGLITTGSLGYIASKIGGIFKTVAEVKASVDELVVTNKAQTRNIQTLLTVDRYMIKAGRQQNMALRELGANGSVTRANECLDEADIALNQQSAKNAGQAMGGCD